MRQLKRIVLLAGVIALILAMVACGQQTAGQTDATGTQSAAGTQSAVATGSAAPSTSAQETVKTEEPVELLVSAAASLKDVMEEIKTAYAAKKGNVTLIFNLGASGALQQQIENGAGADVFISAATKQMDALKDKGLILDETRKDFLENKVVLIAPKDATTVTDFKDLTDPKVKKIGLGQPESVPVGQYAEEVLTSLNILDSIKKENKVVYGKDVKEVLTWVETGNADAGMVYETDAKVSDKVKIVAQAPEGSCKPVYYPAAVIKDSKNQEAAKEFVDFLYSSEAKPIFEKYGFVFMVK